MSNDRQIHVSLLTMATLGHNDYGLWRHPENQRRRFRDADFWRELATVCEEARMDAIFFADNLGISGSFRSSIDVAIREGVAVPILDPLLIAASAMSATRHLGWAATVPTTLEPPFGLARRMATLDHLTDGRAGWNVVMSYIKNAEENYGIDAGSSRDRYDRSEDFMDVCYQLWEASWDDDAVIADEATGHYLDPARVHRIDHVGEHFQSSGPALWDPSPQRTPVIFQAGMSARGRAFAARHAEVAFLVNRMEDDEFIRTVQDLRARARGFGRAPDEMKVLAYAGIITGETEAEARAKLAEYERYTRIEGYMTSEYALSGFDPTSFPRDMLVGEALEASGFRDDGAVYARNASWTIGELLDHLRDLTSEKMTAVGDPRQVSDLLEQWMDEYDLDGFLLRSLMFPHSAADFRDFIMPELQRRGRYRTEYEGSTLRENIFGPGHRRLADTHPGAGFASPRA